MNSVLIKLNTYSGCVVFKYKLLFINIKAPSRSWNKHVIACTIIELSQIIASLIKKLCKNYSKETNY
jgi:hypothetical protein